MAKLYERVNWEDLPSKNTPINAENLNKMDKAIDDLDDKIVELESDMEEVFQSVSSGKAMVASAITDMGVLTELDAKFETMAGNIEKIPKGSDYIMVAEMEIDSHIDYVTVVKEEE